MIIDYYNSYMCDENKDLPIKVEMVKAHHTVPKNEVKLIRVVCLGFNDMSINGDYIYVPDL